MVKKGKKVPKEVKSILKKTGSIKKNKNVSYSEEESSSSDSEEEKEKTPSPKKKKVKYILSDFKKDLEHHIRDKIKVIEIMKSHPGFVHNDDIKIFETLDESFQSNFITMYRNIKGDFHTLFKVFIAEKEIRQFCIRYRSVAIKNLNTKDVISDNEELLPPLLFSKFVALSPKKRLSICDKYLYSTELFSSFLTVDKCNENNFSQCKDKSEVCNISLGQCIREEDMEGPINSIKIGDSKIIGSNEAISKLSKKLEDEKEDNEKNFKKELSINIGDKKKIVDLLNNKPEFVNTDDKNTFKELEDSFKINFINMYISIKGSFHDLFKIFISEKEIRQFCMKYYTKVGKKGEKEKTVLSDIKYLINSALFNKFVELSPEKRLSVCKDYIYNSKLFTTFFSKNTKKVETILKKKIIKDDISFLDFILDNYNIRDEDLVFMWRNLSENPNITIKDILDNIDDPWDWGLISKNPNINMKFVLNNLNNAWDWNELSCHPNITLKDVLDNPNSQDINWSMEYLSKNPNITMNDIKNNPDINWSMEYLSKNPNITMKDIKNNPDIDWDFTILSNNQNITMKDVKDNPDKHWDYSYLSLNPNISMTDVADSPTKHWDWLNLSSNPNINMNYVLNNPKKPWSWTLLSSNPSITLQDILDNPKKPWDWEYVSENPNITIKFVLNNPDKNWNWINLSSNKLNKKEKINKKLIENKEESLREEQLKIKEMELKEKKREFEKEQLRITKEVEEKLRKKDMELKECNRKSGYEDGKTLPPASPRLKPIETLDKFKELFGTPTTKGELFSSSKNNITSSPISLSRDKTSLSDLKDLINDRPLPTSSPLQRKKYRDDDISKTHITSSPSLSRDKTSLSDLKELLGDTESPTSSPLQRKKYRDDDDIEGEEIFEESPLIEMSLENLKSLMGDDSDGEKEKKERKQEKKERKQEKKERKQEKEANDSFADMNRKRKEKIENKERKEQEIEDKKQEELKRIIKEKLEGEERRKTLTKIGRKPEEDRESRKKIEEELARRDDENLLEDLPLKENILALSKELDKPQKEIAKCLGLLL